MTAELHSLIARKVRDRLRLRLGPNALSLVKLNWPLMLDPYEADQVADAVIEVLGELGLIAGETEQTCTHRDIPEATT